MEDILKQILSELEKVNTRIDSLERGQQVLFKEMNKLKSGQEQTIEELIEELCPYLEKIEKQIDIKINVNKHLS